MDDNWFSAVSYCGYHDCGVYCDMGLRFSDRLQTYACCDDPLEVRLPGEPCLPRSTQFGLEGGGSLEVSVLGLGRTGASWNGQDSL